MIFRRPGSADGSPCPQEIWSQDGNQILYIEAMDYAGVHLLTLAPSRGELLRWIDSRPQWGDRLSPLHIAVALEKYSLG
jgi:hypothetical protein